MLRQVIQPVRSLTLVPILIVLFLSQGSRPTRTLFGKARKSPHCSWLIYEASAMMEYHCSKDTVVATKVFELALKTFPENETLVVRYLDFLISINDEKSE